MNHLDGVAVTIVLLPPPNASAIFTNGPVGLAERATSTA